MMRFTWRQARPNVVSTGALLLALAVFAVLTERAMTSYLTSSGLGACEAAKGSCDSLVQDFSDKFSGVIALFQWLNLVPLLAGVFWGGPVIAREIEQGTHRLAWTQSVTRRRWLTVRLGTYLLGACLAAAVATWITTWLFNPIANVDAVSRFGDYSRMQQQVFNFEGIVPVAHTVFAFAVGDAAGAVTKKVLPAMAVTFAVYVPSLLYLQGIRRYVLAPMTVAFPITGTSPRAGRGDYIWSQRLVDASGQPVTAGLPTACQGTGAASHAVCSGYSFADTYQPVSRFWPLQFIESGIFVGGAVVFLSIAIWWTLRRVS